MMCPILILFYFGFFFVLVLPFLPPPKI